MISVLRHHKGIDSDYLKAAKACDRNPSPQRHEDAKSQKNTSSCPSRLLLLGVLGVFVVKIFVPYGLVSA